MPLPASLFSELLPSIDDLAELKLTLYILYVLAHSDAPRAFSLAELLAEPSLMEAMNCCSGRPAADVLFKALERATARGTLLHAVRLRGDEECDYYVLNDAAGRDLTLSLAAGREDEPALTGTPASWRLDRPNIFILYEQNIGLLQPLIVEELRVAEQTYPLEWLEEAFRIAVERNARNWRYIRAILERWAREGKTYGITEGDSRTSHQKYTDGPYGRHVRR